VDLLEYIKDLHRISIKQAQQTDDPYQKFWWAGKTDAYDSLITLIQCERDRSSGFHGYMELHSVQYAS